MPTTSRAMASTTAGSRSPPEPLETGAETGDRFPRFRQLGAHMTTPIMRRHRADLRAMIWLVVMSSAIPIVVIAYGWIVRCRWPA